MYQDKKQNKFYEKEIGKYTECIFTVVMNSMILSLSYESRNEFWPSKAAVRNFLRIISSLEYSGNFK